MYNKLKRTNKGCNMYGTMPDFSNFKHIDLTDNCGTYKDGSLIASSITNNFGDKTIYYRMFTNRKEKGQTLSGFETIDVITYHEGNHPSFKEMLETAKRLVK